MNIKEVKEEIKHTLQAYHKKDEGGNYIFPRLRQRPILLMGPPGIGKTAIMEQIASECDVGLVSYTITHHTRQSAIGLPLIKSRNFDGEMMDVTEYTMSEIIASVYDCMEQKGKKEGILAGISSGAVLHAAVTLSKRDENKGKNIVTILFDSADRYFSTSLFE